MSSLCWLELLAPNNTLSCRRNDEPLNSAAFEDKFQEVVGHTSLRNGKGLEIAYYYYTDNTFYHVTR